VALIGTGEGFNIIDGQGLSDLKGEFSKALDGVVDANGKLWYVTNGSIITYDGKNWDVVGRPQGVYTLYAITIDQDGRVWLGHFRGVSVLEGGQWRTYSSDTFGLGDLASLVNDIAVDHQNRIWVATAAGVAFLTGETWTPYDESKGLTNNSTEAVMTDHQGRVWVAHSDGVDVFDGNKWVFYGKKYDKPAQIEKEQLTGATALAVDGQGIVWVGTSAKGLSYFDGSTWQTYDCREHFYGAGVNTITCDKQGHIWLGTNFGMTVFDGSTWSQYTRNSSGLLSNTINIILVTGAGPASLPTAPGLQPGGIRGKIKSGDQPLAGAKVVVCWETAMFYSGSSPCSGDAYIAMTNADGDFYIDGVPPYRYSLAIQKPDGTWKIKLGWVYIIDGGATSMGSLSV
jgi:ligand-binding sensor domain-containing protein